MQFMRFLRFNLIWRTCEYKIKEQTKNLNKDRMIFILPLLELHEFPSIFFYFPSFLCHWTWIESWFQLIYKISFWKNVELFFFIFRSFHLALSNGFWWKQIEHHRSLLFTWCWHNVIYRFIHSMWNNSFQFLLLSKRV